MSLATLSYNNDEVMIQKSPPDAESFPGKRSDLLSLLVSYLNEFFECYFPYLSFPHDLHTKNKTPTDYTKLNYQITVFKK